MNPRQFTAITTVLIINLILLAMIAFSAVAANQGPVEVEGTGHMFCPDTTNDGYYNPPAVCWAD